MQIQVYVYVCFVRVYVYMYMYAWGVANSLKAGVFEAGVRGHPIHDEMF